MIDESPELAPRYRSPRAFGPMPGPRNIPASQRGLAGHPDEVTTSLSVTLAADPTGLERLWLSGVAEVTVTVTRFEHLLWLAGRGYPILTVTVPVTYQGETADDNVEGRYLAVLWEGLADPVTTGREELGFPKLPADIAAPRVDYISATGAVAASAAWDGFRFLDVSVEELHDAPAADGAPPRGTIVHRYVPSVVEPGRADVDQLVYHPFRPGSTHPELTHRLTGTGRFAFRHAQFVDSPVQYPVVNALAALSLSASGPATLTRSVAEPGSTAGSFAPRLLAGTPGRSAASVAPASPVAAGARV